MLLHCLILRTVLAGHVIFPSMDGHRLDTHAVHVSEIDALIDALDTDDIAEML